MWPTLLFGHGAPGERYGTAQELAEDLRRFVNDQPVQARLPTRLQQAVKWAPLGALAVPLLAKSPPLRPIFLAQPAMPIYCTGQQIRAPVGVRAFFLRDLFRDLSGLVVEGVQMTARLGPDTDELVRRVGEGDQAAVSQFLDRHRARLRRMVTARLDPRLLARVDPSDVVQVVLLKAAQRLPEYARDRPLPFYPWLRQLAWDRLVELHHHHIRAHKRSVTREQPDPLLSDPSALLLAEQLVDSGTGPNAQLLRKELRERVRAALAGLPAQDREILLMRHVEQLKVSEIATSLRLSEGAVKMRRLRAIQKLRELLDKGPSEGQP
jgi:RNA polymerase sigma-70 factor (ECF subfamily)